MRIFVTGASGFAGRHLVRELARQGWTVYGLIRRPQQARMLRALGAIPVPGDITRPATLHRAVRLSRPDAAVHLAAMAFVPDVQKDPLRARRVFVEGTENLLKALPPSCRILFVSSGMVYAPASRTLPDESTPPMPANPYGALKLEAEIRALALRSDVLIARPFNHAGPGQDPRFVVSDFARQIARIEAGLQEPVMTVGDLRSRRAFLDVRDVARAYALLLKKGRPGTVYNVSGPEVSIESLLQGLRRLSTAKVRVTSSADRRRGPSRFAGSAARLRRETGWKPRIPLSKTLKDVLSEWRKQETPR